eukprot:2743016-Rhodomonas_salina.1
MELLATLRAESRGSEQAATTMELLATLRAESRGSEQAATMMKLSAEPAATTMKLRVDAPSNYEA